MSRQAAALLVMLSLLAGCASLPLAPGCTRLGHDGVFCPLPPAALPAVSVSHLVTVMHAGHAQTFIGRLQIDAHHLRLAGLSLFGTELFRLDYDGRHIASHSVRGNLHPEWLLAILELTLAPAAELPPQLHNLTFTVGPPGARQVRELWESGQLLVRIETTAGPLASAQIRIAIPPAKLTLLLMPLAASGNRP